METNIEIILDNAGGIQLQTPTYCHDYTGSNIAAQAAGDLRLIIEENDDCAEWENNHCEFRREASEHDQVLSGEDIAAIIRAGDAIARVAEGYSGFTLICELLGASATCAIADYTKKIAQEEAIDLDAAREYVACHEDEDDMDEDELADVFVQVYGRKPDAKDRRDGLWSLICAGI
jgi:hypothetical protein